jgi:oligopeptide/dipeptide ABC transporter ATP-binding protein
MILRVADLVVAFPRRDGDGEFRAVDGVSLSLARGETLGLVGESGSGKTMTALSLLGLVPKPGRIVAGSVELAGEDLLAMPEAVLRARRGRGIAMVFQDPMTGLNPVRSIGSLLGESLRRHQGLRGQAARTRALAALEDVGIPSARARLNAYPHELSGGLRQRVMIALALINQPAVLVADEPTTALDATIQAQILDLLRAHARARAMILITHDLGVAGELCDQIAVMYHGRIVEAGPSASLLASPRHPYTRGLLAAVPRFDPARPRLSPIPGSPPSPDAALAGCAFAPRCARADRHCLGVPALARGPRGAVACWHPHDVAAQHG